MKQYFSWLKKTHIVSEKPDSSDSHNVHRLIPVLWHHIRKKCNCDTLQYRAYKHCQLRLIHIWIFIYLHLNVTSALWYLVSLMLKIYIKSGQNILDMQNLNLCQMKDKMGPDVSFKQSFAVTVFHHFINCASLCVTRAIQTFFR